MYDISSEFFDAIPAAIRPLVLNYSVLPSEDPKNYRALFVELWRLLKPSDVLLWLDLKKLVDLIWEGLRLGQIKAEIHIAAQKNSLASLLLSMTNESIRHYTPSGTVAHAQMAALGYFTDPVIKKDVLAQFAKFNYSEKTIDAVAFARHAPELAMIDKMQMSNQACQLAVRRQFEETQEALEFCSRISIEHDMQPRRLPTHAGTDDKKDQAESAAGGITQGKNEHAEVEHAVGGGETQELEPSGCRRRRGRQARGDRRRPGGSRAVGSDGLVHDEPQRDRRQSAQRTEKAPCTELREYVVISITIRDSGGVSAPSGWKAFEHSPH